MSDSNPTNQVAYAVDIYNFSHALLVDSNGALMVSESGGGGVTSDVNISKVGGNSITTSLPVSGSFWQTTQPVSIASMPTTPVTGTFWQTTQPVSIAAMPTTPVTGTFWQATQPVSVAGTLTISGAVSVSNFPSSQAVTGTFFQSTQPVSIATMPTTPVTGTFFQATQPVSIAATVTTTDTRLPTALGQTTMSASLPVVIASDQSMLNTLLPDTYITGQGTQTVLNNNILLASAGAGSVDVSGYRSISVQIDSTGTGGAYIFEGSNDNTNWVSIPLTNITSTTGTLVNAAVTASATNIIYTGALNTRYIRCRISTAITGGSLQAFTRISQAAWTSNILQVGQNTASNFNVTIASLTSSSIVASPFPTSVTDIASAAIATTTTTAALTPGFGNSFQVNIVVTAATGSTPTMDVEIQESRDAGTNWVAIYDFPRITTTGSFNSPLLPTTGNRLRYVQTIGGSTPSFTRAIVRLQDCGSIVPVIRQIVDRTVSLTTLSSTTAVLTAEQNTKNVQMTINIGAASIGPTLQIQASDDAGASWYSVGSTLLGVASSTVSVTVANVTAQMYRAIVTIVGSGVTAGYVLLRAF